jgi:hypothetical protein
MTASRPAPPPPTARAPETASELELVESTAGWQVTITLTERLRAALADSKDVDGLTVHVAPNLVPGEPFQARLHFRESGAPSRSPGR